MAVDVVTQAIIERSCAEVAEYVANPDNAPEWYVNIESVEAIRSDHGKADTEQRPTGQQRPYRQPLPSYAG